MDTYQATPIAIDLSHDTGSVYVLIAISTIYGAKKQDDSEPTLIPC